MSSNQRPEDRAAERTLAEAFALAAARTGTPDTVLDLASRTSSTALLEGLVLHADPDVAARILRRRLLPEDSVRGLAEQILHEQAPLAVRVAAIEVLDPSDYPARTTLDHPALVAAAMARIDEHTPDVTAINVLPTLATAPLPLLDDAAFEETLARIGHPGDLAEKGPLRAELVIDTWATYGRRRPDGGNRLLRHWHQQAQQAGEPVVDVLWGLVDRHVQSEWITPDLVSSFVDHQLHAAGSIGDEPWLPWTFASVLDRVPAAALVRIAAWAQREQAAHQALRATYSDDLRIMASLAALTREDCFADLAWDTEPEHRVRHLLSLYAERLTPEVADVLVRRADLDDDTVAVLARSHRHTLTALCPDLAAWVAVRPGHRWHAALCRAQPAVLTRLPDATFPAALRAVLTDPSALRLLAGTGISDASGTLPDLAARMVDHLGTLPLSALSGLTEAFPDLAASLLAEHVTRSGWPPAALSSAVAAASTLGYGRDDVTVDDLLTAAAATAS